MSKLYEVGDEAELSPALMNRFLTEIVAQGATVQIKGNKAVVVAVKHQNEASAEPIPVDAAADGEPPPVPKKTAPRKKAPAPRSEE